MKIFISFIRAVVGLLFIFSGLIKANDPLGLSYKMQEFFEVWNVHFLNTYALSFSLIIITFEIVAGCALLLGWQKKVFLWLLLLLTIFFSFLTGYALFSSKIKTCGCFGDCIPLTAQQSFIKDIALLILVSVLFLYKRYIKSIFNPLVTIVILLFITVSMVLLQRYVLKHLPIVDCLPYKKNNHLPTLMQPSASALADSIVITFTYIKNQKTIEFTANQFPEDFNDSIYRFVKRYDKIVRKGSNEAVIRDFTLNSVYDGNDSTQALLQYPGNLLILFMQQASISDDWLKNIEELNSLLKKCPNSMLIIATSNINQVNDIIYNQLHIYPSVFKCDATIIKAIARANPTLYLLKKGRIIDKWSYVDFDIVVKQVGIYCK